MGSPTAFIFVFMAVIVGIQSLNPLLFKDCGSKGGKVQSVGYNGTVDADKHAILKKGTYAQLQISIDSTEDSSKLTSVVHGIIGEIPIPFPMPNPDACVSCNITCPVHTSKHYNYAPVIHVLSSYPSIKLVVKWEVKDDKDNDFICIEFPVVIKS